MKAYGIGLILLLVAFALGVYSAYVNYKWTSKLLSPKTPEETKAMADELTLVSLIGLVANILALVGILVFLVEFWKHEHPHEHEFSASRTIPPPP